MIPSSRSFYVDSLIHKTKREETNECRPTKDTNVSQNITNDEAMSSHRVRCLPTNAADGGSLHSMAFSQNPNAAALDIFMRSLQQQHQSSTIYPYNVGANPFTTHLTNPSFTFTSRLQSSTLVGTEPPLCPCPFCRPFFRGMSTDLLSNALVKSTLVSNGRSTSETSFGDISPIRHSPERSRRSPTRAPTIKESLHAPAVRRSEFEREKAYWVSRISRQDSKEDVGNVSRLRLSSCLSTSSSIADGAGTDTRKIDAGTR